MRKGRFTQSEIQKAIASNCLGVEAFFCSLLEVIIKGTFVYSSNKNIQFKYFSYQNIAFTKMDGFNYPKNRKDFSKNLKKLHVFLKREFIGIKSEYKIELFVHLSLSFIVLLNSLNPPKEVIEKVKANLNELTECRKAFFEIEYEYLKNKLNINSSDLLLKYVTLYESSLSQLLGDGDKKHILLHIENILDRLLKPEKTILEESVNTGKKIVEELFNLSVYYYNFSEKSYVNNHLRQPHKKEYLKEVDAKIWNILGNSFLLKSNLQLININMPKHNGRTLLLKMLEGLIELLNLDLKYDFNKTIFKEIKNNPNIDYYVNFFQILSNINLIGPKNHFHLHPNFERAMTSIIEKYNNQQEKDCDRIKDDDEKKFFELSSSQIIYIPVVIDVIKGNYESLPIEICLHAIHYLYKISILNEHAYKQALEDIIVLYNREFYLNNDLKMNSKSYIYSQAKRRDNVLSAILHKYIGFSDIKIIAMLDEIQDFNSFDEAMLEKNLRKIEFTGINLFIIKFQDKKGTQVKFSIKDYIDLKVETSESLNAENPFNFFGINYVDFSTNLNYEKLEGRILEEMGTEKYKSLHAAENYFYGRSILYNQETIPIITKYEINEFYEDILNLKAIVADLNNIIATNQKTSFYGGYSIGVLGNFGAGKSSIINLLFSMLSSKNTYETDDIHKEKTYRITLSDYSSESIVEEVYLQLEKSIIKDYISTPVRKKKKLFFRILHHLNVFGWNLEKHYIKNKFYAQEILENCLPKEKKDIRKKIAEIEPYSKRFILHTYEKLITDEETVAKIKNDVRLKRDLKISKKQYYKDKAYKVITNSEHSAARESKKLKKKIDNYVFSNHRISTTKEIENNTELRKKKNYFIIAAIISSVVSIGLWILFVVLYVVANGETKTGGNVIYKDNLFNFVPLLATIPAFITSFFIYQGVRGRETTFLSENKLAVYHIEKLLEYSKILRYKKGDAFQKYKKYDKRLKTYPLNTIIMIDNLDRISNERVGNVLQGISFINNEIECSNISFIIPISYEKFYENTLFLNEQYTVAKDQPPQYTYKNPDMNMPIVINNAYLNKVFDYKIYLPSLSKQKYKNFICFALNKAIDRRFIVLSSSEINNYIEFLANYFEQRETRNLRDIANVLNDAFTHFFIVNQYKDKIEKYFAMILIIIFCDIRYRFVEGVEELVLSDKFITHLSDALFSNSYNSKPFYDYYSIFFKQKYENTQEGKQYENFFGKIIQLLSSEIQNNGKKKISKEYIFSCWEKFKENKE